MDAQPLIAILVQTRTEQNLPVKRSRYLFRMRNPILDVRRDRRYPRVQLGHIARYYFGQHQTEEGLPNESVLGIVRHLAGNIWLSTHNGLSQFNPESQTFKNYDPERGLVGATFPRPALIQSYSGEILAGGTHGLTIFKPSNIYSNTAIPNIKITQFYLASQPVKPSDNGSPRNLPIEETKAITLGYNQSDFAFDFVALNFKVPSRNQFKYRLKGFDEDWQLPGSRRTAIYTNIDPSGYTFQVIGSNNDGVWNMDGASLDIHPTLRLSIILIRNCPAF